MIRIFFFGILILFSFKLSGQLHHTDEDLPCLNKTFKVHVHLVRDSLGNLLVNMSELNEMFALANEKFAPICMEFEVCQIDTIINYNYSFILNRLTYYKEMNAKFAHANRINLFLMRRNYDPQDMVSGICGYTNKSIFLSCPDNFPHELGHFFGLYDTHRGAGQENVDGSNCETHGDEICDTPADPYQIAWTGVLNSNCEYIGDVKDSNGQYYTPHTGNIMSAYGCPCQEFSKGQFLRMVETYKGLYKNLW